MFSCDSLTFALPCAHTSQFSFQLPSAHALLQGPTPVCPHRGSPPSAHPHPSILPTPPCWVRAEAVMAPRGSAAAHPASSGPLASSEPAGCPHLSSLQRLPVPPLFQPQSPPLGSHPTALYPDPFLGAPSAPLHSHSAREPTYSVPLGTRPSICGSHGSPALILESPLAASGEPIASRLFPSPLASWIPGQRPLRFPVLWPRAAPLLLLKRGIRERMLRRKFTESQCFLPETRWC